MSRSVVLRSVWKTGKAVKITDEDWRNREKWDAYEKAVDEMLTFCLDPLAEMMQQEANRKRNGRDNVLKGTKMVIDTRKVKHMDLFDIATPGDKLIGSGIATINMLLRAIGEPRINEEWLTGT